MLLINQHSIFDFSAEGRTPIHKNTLQYSAKVHIICSQLPVYSVHTGFIYFHALFLLLFSGTTRYRSLCKYRVSDWSQSIALPPIPHFIIGKGTFNSRYDSGHVRHSSDTDTVTLSVLKSQMAYI